MVPYSVLDLCPIVQGGDAAQALQRSLDLARHVERLGYQRFWLAEHHNMPGIASAATAVVIGHVAAGTTRIRVGSGGVMLPNHAPLVIAEQFGTLAALFPGRIDLGLGRAPGTDPVTAHALRRSRTEGVDTFPDDVQELQAYFGPAGRGQPVRAIPGEGLGVPLWLLGSSLFSAQLAASLGLPFAFAAHFAPDYLEQALEVYRATFRPSPALEQPYAMACIGVYAAESDAEAARLITSVQQSFVALRRGMPAPLPPPLPTPPRWSTGDQAILTHTLREAVVGGPATVTAGLRRFLERTGVDELMVTTAIFDHAARLQSFALVRDAMQALDATATMAAGARDDDL